MTKHSTAAKLELEASTRDIVGSRVRQLRATGVVPAVLYGKGQEAMSVQVSGKEFDGIFRKAGESTLVYLKVGGQSYPTIIKEVERDALTGETLHADFYKVSLTEKIKAMVPVVFVGESPAVKELKAIFVRNVNELEVEALPQNLPHEVTVDVSSLKNFGDQITLGDVNVDDAVLVGGADEIIATVQEPKSEAELEAELAAPTTDVSAVEEIKKEEKPAEEGEEGAEAAPAEATE
ncbi:MAG: 50S ribosomal protein L25 [Candidatus Yanofskybacteria bacterium]|nr:50S ribosomal protein L25 [Candidatus Yanofskybacteria bacterium]